MRNERDIQKISNEKNYHKKYFFENKSVTRGITRTRRKAKKINRKKLIENSKLIPQKITLFVKVI